MHTNDAFIFNSESATAWEMLDLDLKSIQNTTKVSTLGYDITKL